MPASAFRRGYSGGGKGLIEKFEAGGMPSHGAYGLPLATNIFLK